MEFHKHKKSRFFRHFISSPFIYGMIIPSVILDIFIEVYHRICFPLYGIPYVKRSAYIRIDRQKLSYLSFMEKINCTYCGYVNGLFAYSVRIAGETEKYWCAIKHKKDESLVELPHQDSFIDYGDEQSYEKLKKSSE